MHKYTKISILSPLFFRSWVNEYFLSDKKVIWDSNLFITKLTNWAIFVQIKEKSNPWWPCSGFVFFFFLWLYFWAQWCCFATEHDFGAQVLNFFLCFRLVMDPEIPNCKNFEVDFPSGVSALPVWVYFLGAQLHDFFSLLSQWQSGLYGPQCLKYLLSGHSSENFASACSV